MSKSVTKQADQKPSIDYDCDTRVYWCSETDYHDREKNFGIFEEGGRAYRILDPNTPRPWLNYLANAHFGSVVSNTGLGFNWYNSTLLRITKYEHAIDYLPREFEDGREIFLCDRSTNEQTNLLREASRLECVHRPGCSTLKGTCQDIEFAVDFFCASPRPM